jgi:hypothetical protein
VFLLVSGVVSAQTAPNLDLVVPSDSIKKDTTTFEELKLNINRNKGDIESAIYYTATDSIVLDVVPKKIYLYGKAKVIYGETNLDAERIEIDWKENTMYAYGIEDSTGKRIGNPVFKEKQDIYVAKKIVYNFKSKKGIIYDVVTKQGEGYVHGEKIKKSDTEELYVSSAKYTTCNHPNPHFEINATKIKVVPNKRIISGPFNLRVNNVPTPLGFLFGIFPTPKDKAAGLVFPEYGISPDRGVFFRNGGYYFPIGDYIGVKALGEIYTNGSWGLNMIADYKVRYRYDGELNVRFNDRVQDETMRNIRDFWVSLRHRPVQRAGQTFNAEVNVGTSSFNRNNSFNQNNFLSNTFNSNISYSKAIKKTPFSFSLAARGDMNTITNEQNYSLPEGNLAMSRIYPVKKLTKSNKNNWYNNLNLAYNFQVKNAITNSRSTYFRNGEMLRDTVLPFKQENQDLLLQRLNNGGRHEIPIGTTVKMLKYFTLNPYFRYEEFWYLRQNTYRLDSLTNSIMVKDTINSFFRANSYSGGATMTTRLYGTVFVRKAGIEAIRHVVMPTFSISYKPDFSKNSANFQQFEITDRNNGQTRTIYQSKFTNSIFGGPTAGEQGNIGFDLNNTFEMKVKNKKDTVNPFAKVMLLDNLNLGASYNLLADSLNLSFIRVGARTTIARLLNFNFNANLDPYSYDLDSTKGRTNFQRRVNDYRISRGEGLAAIQDMNIAIGASLKPTTKPLPTPANIPQSELDFIRNNPDRYVDFNIPWNLNINYNVGYAKIGYNSAVVNQSITGGGDINITDTWKVSVNTGLDIKTLKTTFTQINIYKNLHCWEMRFSIVPTGTRASVVFNINVKASTLQDLKLSRNRNWYDN